MRTVRLAQTVVERHVRWGILALGALALASASCGGGPPSSSTPPTTAPSPAPTPSSGPGPGASSCPIGKGSVSATCERSTSALLPDIERAMDLLIEHEPQIFDLRDERLRGSRAYRVLDPEAYLDGLVANLRAAGICAERDADDAFYETIRVKNHNDFSEDFDVFLNTGHMRRGPDSYRQTCTPSAFPVERDPEAPPVEVRCGRPYPPPVTSIKCKVHLKGAEYHTLDSTPIVGPDAAYCASIGYADGRWFCPVRPEGWPDRAACEAWRVGVAVDTGRPGPTWTRAGGSFCTGPASGCANHPGNQFQLLAYRRGTYTAVGENGVSCSVVVQR